MRDSIKQINKDLIRIKGAIKALESRHIDRWDAYLKAWKRGKDVRPPCNKYSEYIIGVLIAKTFKLKMALEALEVK
jgi:hypothetical protein